MIVATEIIVGENPPVDITAAAETLAKVCQDRHFPVHVLAAPTSIDNRLCLYLSTPTAGHPVDDLLDRGVRRDAFARLDHTQYLIRSWRGEARLHIALAARSGPALRAAARDLAGRIAAKGDFTNLDLQGSQQKQAE